MPIRISNVIHIIDLVLQSFFFKTGFKEENYLKYKHKREKYVKQKLVT